ncbi:MAG: DUF4350 domain-containing protein [Pseudomonadota bacterium]
MDQRSLMIAASVLLLAGGVGILLFTVGDPRCPPPYPSTYYGGPGGAKALFICLREQHLPVVRLRRPYDKLGNYRGVLLVIEPRARGISDREARKLEEWVKDGNELVMFHGFLPGDRARTEGEAPQESGRRRGDRSMDHPAAERFDLQLKDVNDPERRAVKVRVPGVEGIERINAGGRARWKDPQSAWTSLAADAKGSIALTKEFGKGRVTAVSDPGMATNANLGRERNLEFLYALILKDGMPEQILIDEFHHGHVQTETIGRYVGESVFAWVLIQCLVGFLLFIYSRRARQAGRYLSLGSPIGRSSLEYVESMANVFESCKAASTALDAILRRFMIRVARNTGITVKALEDVAHKGPRRGLPAVDEPISAVVREAREAVEAGSGPETCLELARRIAGINLRLRGRARLARVDPVRPDPDHVDRSQGRKDR